MTSPRLAILLLIAAPGATQALESNLRISALSNYVYRGISQSNGSSAGQVSLEIQGEQGWFGGITISSVDYARANDNRQRELVSFAGWHQRHNHYWSYAASITYTDYETDSPTDYDWGEAQLRVQAGDHWTIVYAYSANWYGFDTDSHTFELRHAYALAPNVTTGIDLGYSNIGSPIIDEYAYARFELAWKIKPITARIGYSTTTSADRLGAAAVGQWTLGLSWNRRW